MKHHGLITPGLLVIVAFSLILVSCNTQNYDPNSALSITSDPLTSSSPDSKTILTPTASSINISSQNLSAVQTKSCVPMIEPLPFNLDGYLLFQSYDGDVKSVTNGAESSDNLETLNALNSTPLGFSPNNQWFAYYVSTTSPPDKVQNQLYVIDAITHRTLVVEADKLANEEIWVGVRWLSNDLILVPSLISQGESPQTLSTKIVDPFSGIWSKALFDGLPHYLPPYEALGLSPDSSKALYVSTNTEGQNIQLELVLRDILLGEDLWRATIVGHSLQYSGRLDELGAISWASNNRRVAFSGKIVGSGLDNQEGLYILDTELLSLKLVISNEEPLVSSMFHGLSWSPDGRFLAYRFQGRNNDLSFQKEELQVYDTENDLVFLTCPSTIELAKFSSTSFLWSPNSTQVAFMGEGVVRDENFVLGIFVIDLLSGKLVERIAEGNLIGWLNSIP